MVKLRMQRGGKTNRPYYRIVAAHSTRSRNGAYIERIGSYNAITKPAEVIVDEAKAIKWLQNGAQPSDTVKSLFKNLGIMYKFRLVARGLAEDQVQSEMDKWKAKQAERAATKRVKKTRAIRKKSEKPAEEAPAS